MPLDRLPRRISIGCLNAMVLCVAVGCHSTMVQPAVLSSGKSSSSANQAKAAADSRIDPAVKRVAIDSSADSFDSSSASQSPPDLDTVLSATPPVSAELVSIDAPAKSTSDSGPGDPLAEILPTSELTAVPKFVGKEEVTGDIETPVKTASNPGVVRVDPHDWEPKNGHSPDKEASATPMIDAALKRAEQAKRLTVQDLQAKAGVSSSPESKTQAPPSPQPTPPSAQPPQPLPAAALVTEKRTSQPPSPEQIGPPAPLGLPDRPSVATSPKSEESESTPDTVSTPPREDRFEIANTRLCRRVLTFGSTVRLASDRLKPGQSVVLYAELEGLKDEQKGSQFHSRLASGIQCFRKTAGAPEKGSAAAWNQEFGNVEDICDHRRRDFYVNYVVTVPKTLEPGEYTLELSVTDLISERSAKSVMSFTVSP